MYLGLDLGTSSLKALLVDEEQRIMAEAVEPLRVSRPHPGWSEQDPASWIEAAIHALDAMKASWPRELAAVRGIGLSGHMHGATLVGKDDKPLRPCILWNDTRSHLEAAELDSMPEFRAISGNIVFPGFTAPKLVWVRRNEPQVMERVAKVLLPKDYLRLFLTGGHVSEMSDSAGTSWLDTGKRQWSPELLSLSGMEERQMPSLVEGSENSGHLRAELLARWGMKGPVAVAGGAGDNAASAVGMGTVSPGSAFVSLGTSGVIFAATGSYLPNPASAVHAFCHALPGMWHQMGVILSATDALNWYAGIAGVSAGELTSALGDRLMPPGGALFLPYLSGERTPHNDAAARGAFAGLAHGDDRAALTRAVLEGVAFALADNLDALEQAGTRLDRVVAVGGGSRSRYWLEVIATVLGLPVDIPAEGDYGAAFGAARLGIIAAEGGDSFSVARPPAIIDTVMPVTGLTDAFKEQRARFRSLYPAIKGVMK